MKRYIDFQADEWAERTDSRMQAARWEACVNGLSDDPPLAGVLDTYPDDLLFELISEGWTSIPSLPLDEEARAAAREAILTTLADDVDCLGLDEHSLMERMLIGDGVVSMDSVAELEAAYTLRLRLWCDIGLAGGVPMARLDEKLRERLPELMMRPVHQERRGRIFVFDGMIHGMLYVSGFLDDRLPIERFIGEVLQAEPTPQTIRLAKNHLEASFDTYTLSGCNLLIHEALADPEALRGVLQAQGAFQMPPLSPGDLAASMDGLLPQEAGPDEKLQRALHGALRPEYEPYEATSDLRFLIKQDAPMDTLEDIMASMLCVMPTQHMNGALHEMRHHTPRWLRRLPDVPAPGADGAIGRLH